jgi:ribonucleases P/MRP protein subunit RPP40
MKKLSYEIRLKKLDLTSLEKRRTRGDLIETFKILKGMENIHKEQFFELSDTGHNLRGPNMKLAVNRSRLDTKKFFFSNRVVRHWNDLTQEIVDATSVNSFKNRLDKHWSCDMGTYRILSSPPIISQVTSKYQ